MSSPLDNSHNYDYNMCMLSVNKKKIIMFSLGILSLCLGTFIYILFREDTYIAKTVISLIDLSGIKHILYGLDNAFIKYYFPDFLWAFSLCCIVLVILTPKRKRSTIFSSSIIFFWGSLYEILQMMNIISGTGDIVDIMLYLLATLTADIIYLRSCGHEKNF